MDLQKALQNKDSDSLSSSLNALEKRIPPEMLLPKDKEMIAQAREQLDSLEVDKGYFNCILFLSFSAVQKIRKISQLEQSKLF